MNMICLLFLNSLLANDCQINLAFCVDSSGSIININGEFEKEKTFIVTYHEQLLKEFPNTFVKTTAMIFSSETEIAFDYTTYKTNSQVSQALQDMKKAQIVSSTYIATCMQKVRSEPRPDDAPVLLLVVTDGQPSPNDIYSISDVSIAMRNEKFFIQAAGFGDTDYETLESITGSEENVIYEQDLDALGDLLHQLTDNICGKVFPCIQGPPPINNSYYTQDCTDKEIGFECSVECNENYKFVGENPKCQSSGEWYPLPECLMICQAEPEFDHKDVNNSEICSGMFVGQKCSLRCLEGYSIFKGNVTCTDSGNWDSNPMCIPEDQDTVTSTAWPMILGFAWLISALLTGIVTIPKAHYDVYGVDMEEELKYQDVPEVLDPEIKIDYS